MLKVLIADDEAAELRYLENYLREKYSGLLDIAAVCQDGVQAIEKGLETVPDMAFLDIQMPGHTGLEVSRKLKEINPEVTIVILTAFGLFDYAKEAIDIGVASYLVKPFRDEELDKIIDQILEEKRSHSKDEFKRIINQLSNGTELKNNVSPVARKAYTYMSKHFGERISLETVSDAIGFSSSYVSKCLIKDYEKNFNTLLLEIRCNEAAKLLLKGDMNVNEVAAAVGIFDANYFTKCFKVQMGYPPKKYAQFVQSVIPEGK